MLQQKKKGIFQASRRIRKFMLCIKELGFDLVQWLKQLHKKQTLKLLRFKTLFRARTRVILRLKPEIIFLNRVFIKSDVVRARGGCLCLGRNIWPKQTQHTTWIFGQCNDQKSQVLRSDGLLPLLSFSDSCQVAVFQI